MTSIVEAVLSRSREELIELGVLRQGHFQRHDFRHSRWYFDSKPLVFTGALWHVIQDLATIIPTEILDEIEIVAGAQSVGDTMAEGLINVISSRSAKVRQVNCVPIERQFEIVGKDLGKTTYRIRPFYLDRLAGKKVLLADDVIASGKNSTRFCRLLESAGARVVASAFIANLSQLDDPTRFSLWRQPLDEVYARAECPMCRRDEPMTKF